MRPWALNVQGLIEFFSPGVLMALFSLLLGTVWAFAIKPLNAPDEIAHLQTVMEVRKGNLLPEVHYDFSKWSGAGWVIGTPGDQSVRDYAARLGYDDPFLMVPYESMQPPLYYLVAGSVARAIPPDPQAVLYLSRIVAAIFGAGTVYFCWAAARRLAPHAPVWAFAVACIIALLPQFCFNSATVSNDSFLNFCAAALFYVWFRGLREPGYDPMMLRSGALLGFALLAKLPAVEFIPILGLVAGFRAFQSKEGALDAPSINQRLKRALLMGACAAGSALAVSGWWFVRNMVAYGEPSGSRDALRFATTRFHKLDVNSATSPWGVGSFLKTTWQSSWGLFGPMTHGLPSGLYVQAQYLAIGLLALTIFASGRYIWKSVTRRQTIPAHEWQSTLIMAVAAGIVIAGYLQFNLDVSWQPQGRYLFTLLLPASLLYTGGIYTLSRSRSTLPRLKMLVLITPVVWLAFANFVGLMIVSSNG
jgi:4-amino-4-deoxy-L-arabinose transferase-like glycosyltransferase